MMYPLVAAVPLPVLPPVLGLPLFAWIGITIALLLCWQALTGLHIIELGRRFRTIHRATGLTAVSLMVIHIPYALQLLGVI